MIRGIERIGGFGGKADLLAMCTIYTKDPGCFRTQLATVEGATPQQTQSVAQRWLEKPSHTFVVKPGVRKEIAEEASAKPAPFTLPAVDPQYKTTASTVDRSKGVPAVNEFPKLDFPSLQRGKLANGSDLVFVKRSDIPVVNIAYMFNGGYSSDEKGKLGRAALAMKMLDEGAGQYSALDFKSEAEELGAVIATSAGLDGSGATVSALKENLDPSVALFATMLKSPTFDENELKRVKAQSIASIAQEKAQPMSSALRALPPLLYGEGHPYAMPLTGSGTEQDVAGLTRTDLVSYQQNWVRPENNTVVVVGDTTLSEITSVLNKHLGDWKGTSNAGTAIKVPDVARPDKTKVYLIDQQGASQATIIAGQVVPSSKDKGATKLEMSNEVLGGMFSSRLNMNLREDKHWAYGSYSFTQNALGQRPWMAYAPVQIDKTAESIKEVNREVTEYMTGQKPATQEEVTKVVDNSLRGQPGAYETADAVMSTVTGIVRYGRPDNYVEIRNAEIAKLKPADLKKAAETVNPNALTWVIVGDLKQIEAPVRALNLGEVTVLKDEPAKTVTPPAPPAASKK